MRNVQSPHSLVVSTSVNKWLTGDHRLRYAGWEKNTKTSCRINCALVITLDSAWAARFSSEVQYQVCPLPQLHHQRSKGIPMVWLLRQSKATNSMQHPMFGQKVSRLLNQSEIWNNWKTCPIGSPARSQLQLRQTAMNTLVWGKDSVDLS